MLDYKGLRSKFTKALEQFDKEKLERWVAFDSQRETLTKLLSGERVSFVSEVKETNKLSDPRECIFINGDDFIGQAA